MTNTLTSSQTETETLAPSTPSTVDTLKLNNPVLAEIVHTKILQIQAILGKNFRTYEEIANFLDTNTGHILDAAKLPDLFHDLDLSTGTKHALHSANITTTYDLIQNTKFDLLRIPSIGKKRVTEIEEELAKHNLKIKETGWDQNETNRANLESFLEHTPRIVADHMVPYQTCVIKIADEYRNIIHTDTSSSIEPDSKEEEIVIREFLQQYYERGNVICYDRNNDLISAENYINAAWEYTQRENVYFWSFDTSVVEESWMKDLYTINDEIMKEKQWSYFRS